MTARRWFAAVIDRTAHLLYEPATLGRRCVAIRPERERFHSIRLIPGSWLEAACARVDRH